MPCAELSIRRQCELVGISRSGFYYEPVVETLENLVLMRRLDELHLEHLVYGSRRLTALLRREGREVNRKRIVRLLQLMGVEAVYPKRSLSQPTEGHRIYPYYENDRQALRVSFLCHGCCLVGARFAR